MVNKNVKLIIFGEDVRQKILKGVDITARAVGTTLGSKGRNVALQKNWGAPVIIHDGVTVARDIVLPDPFENQAAELMITAAQKTNDEAGDGTTTATVLIYSIVKEALRIISAGTNPMVIRKGIDKALPAVVEYLHTIAKPVSSFEEMKQIATISAANEEMGELIATAIQKVGEHGVVSVQEGTGSMIEVEYKEGLDLPKGTVSPYLYTNLERMETEYKAEKAAKEDMSFPYVVCVNEKLTNSMLAKIAKTISGYDNRYKVLIIADDYENETIRSMVVSKIHNNLRIAAIQSPEFGEHRTNLLWDIAAVTGGHVIGGNTGIPIEDITIDHIGQAEKFIVTKFETLIIGGRGDKKKIEARIQGLRVEKERAKEPGLIDKIESRLAKLVGGVAVISVGASSEAEMREKKERVIDANNATKAAISEGIVPGGGVALLRASTVIDTLNLTEEERIGANILKEAIRYPAYKLIQNAGHDNPGYAVGKILEHDNPAWGYNVETETFENLIDSGIIDPVKVTRTALQNATSIASTLITTECMVVDRPVEKSEEQRIMEGIGQI